MKPARLLPLVLIALTGAGAAWLSRGLPRTDPHTPIDVANSVTSFASDHPEWALLREPRRDSATILLNHARHLDPEAPGMQDLLRAMIDTPGSHVRTVRIGESDLLSLSCASCHQPDDAGAYMKPIRFDDHCVRCHEDQLVRVPAVSADGDEEGVRVPHGDVDAVIGRIERALATRAAFSDSRFASPEAEPEADSGSRRTRGRRGSSGPEEVPAFTSRDEALAWLADERAQFLKRAETACSYCHSAISPHATSDVAGAFTIEKPAIPSVWLPKSWFSHKSHEMLACVACHTQSETGRDTSDIMIPGIANCRECHSPRAGAPSNCTLCHTYHERSPYLEGGSLGIEQFTGSAPQR